MALIALGISPRSMFVPPMTWMTEISPAMDWPHGNESRQVKERKKWFHRASGAKVPQYAGDAVCIMLYGERYVRKNH